MARINPNDADKYQNSLNGEWFSLKNDGDIARVQFMLDSYDDLDVFACHKVKVNDKDRYVDCLRAYNEPIDNCPFCAAGLPVKPVRFVIMFQHDDQKVKIWERGKQFISKLQGLMNRYQPLSNYVFEIERHGKAGDKETKYEIFPMDRVDAFELDEVEKPELLGGLILEKTPEEMMIYLDTGTFPETEEGSAYQSTPAPVVRREATAPPSQASSRRAPASTSTRRAPAATKDEVF